MRTTARLSRLACLGLAALFVAACGEEPAGPELPLDDALTPTAEAKPADRGKKKPGKEDPAPEPEPAPDYVWYRLAVPDDSDPLWRVGIAGETALLESDPTVAGWGTDYWGSWSDPFPFVDGAVHYVTGLTEVTYTFASHPDGFDVSKTLVVQPYLGGEPTTTETHVGVFHPEG